MLDWFWAQLPLGERASRPQARGGHAPAGVAAVIGAANAIGVNIAVLDCFWAQLSLGERATRPQARRERERATRPRARPLSLVLQVLLV